MNCLYEKFLVGEKAIIDEKVVVYDFYRKISSLKTFPYATLIVDEFSIRKGHR